MPPTPPKHPTHEPTSMTPPADTPDDREEEDDRGEKKKAMPPAPATATAPAGVVRGPRREFDILLRATLALFVIGLAVWVMLAASGYRNKYVSANECWRRGGGSLIELTLVREDKMNLACASGATIGDLRCGYGADRRMQPAPGPDESRVLRPYNTTGGQLLLGAGLWSSPNMSKELPAGRFTAWCDFEVVGVVKSVALRWAPSGDFSPTVKALPAGSLHDCVIPE